MYKVKRMNRDSGEKALTGDLLSRKLIKNTKITIYRFTASYYRFAASLFSEKPFNFS